MSKDPAFLLYSKDFYEGTRMMLPEERACYLDLLIYQHQNGEIPNDLKRVQMYCSGCSLETVKEVLNQKFDKSVKGWLNKRLIEETTKRSKSTPKSKASSSLAGLISANKLTKQQSSEIKKNFNIQDFIKYPIDEIPKKVREWFYKSLNQPLNNLENEIESVIEDVIEFNNKNEIVFSSEIFEKEFTDLISEYFLQTTEVQKMKVTGFLKSNHIKPQIENFKEQTKAYAEYKCLTGEKIHSWPSYQTEWDREDWVKKLQREKLNKSRKDGKQDNQNNSGPSDEFRAKTAKRLGIIQS